MKKLMMFVLLTMSSLAFGQFDGMPDSPLDTSMGDAAGNTAGTLNQLTPVNEVEQEQEEERQEELLENRYDVPDEEEENDFNENGTNEP